jgi:osmotically-inducible protein OsmY
VTTRGTTVTLSGVVESKAEHDRALALARETEGVKDVIDNMKMLQPVG